jgi:hypothetical protein
LKTATFSNTLLRIGFEVDSGEGGGRSVNRHGMADHAKTGGFERGEKKREVLGDEGTSWERLKKELTHPEAWVLK